MDGTNKCIAKFMNRGIPHKIVVSSIPYTLIYDMIEQ